MEAKTLALYLGAECMIGDLNWKPDPNTYGLDPMADPDFDKPIRTTIDLHCIMAFDHKMTPILRPLSSMTEEERTECFTISSEIGIEDKFGSTYNGTWWVCPKRVVYLLSKGFDLFGLIEKGEALDSTKL